MPELPEVQTIVDALRPGVQGAVIGRVRLLRTDIVCPPGIDLPKRLRGRCIRSIHRRGKRIIFLLDDANRFYVHLGMTGQLLQQSPGDSIPRHTHLIINTVAGPQIRFNDARRFGGIWWLGKDGDDDTLGPEPLEVAAPELARRLSATRRAIKSALMHQALIAGLGNIYADESLFAARIDPRTPARRLSLQQVQRLLRAIRSTLRSAIRHHGSTVRDYIYGPDQEGNFQNHHRVYQRTGRPCQVCGTPIKRIVLTGRSTHFCPRCQRSR